VGKSNHHKALLRRKESKDRQHISTLFLQGHQVWHGELERNHNVTQYISTLYAITKRWVLVIAYYVLMYCVTLWFLSSSPCQTWWWPCRKRAETYCLSFDSLRLNKVLWCFDLPTLYHYDIVIAHNGDEPPKDW